MHTILWIDSITNFLRITGIPFDWESILSSVFEIIVINPTIPSFLLWKKFLHFLLENHHSPQ